MTPELKECMVMKLEKVSKNLEKLSEKIDTEYFTDAIGFVAGKLKSEKVLILDETLYQLLIEVLVWNVAEVRSVDDVLGKLEEDYGKDSPIYRLSKKIMEM